MGFFVLNSTIVMNYLNLKTFENSTNKLTVICTWNMKEKYSHINVYRDMLLWWGGCIFHKKSLNMSPIF